MDRRKLSLTLSEDDLRRNSQTESRRGTPTPANFISEDELRKRIRELMAEEKPSERRDPPRPVTAVTPMIARREPSPFPPKPVNRSPLPRREKQEVKQSPYRRVNNQQYFNWDDDEEPAPTEQSTVLPRPHSHAQSRYSPIVKYINHRLRWDDPPLHSKDNCELCALAKKALDREQVRKLKKTSSSVSRHCETLREFQEDYRE